VYNFFGKTLENWKQTCYLLFYEIERYIIIIILNYLVIIITNTEVTDTEYFRVLSSV